MKYVIFICFVLASFHTSYAQGYNNEGFALSKFIERMYTNEPFEGCRIVEDYDNTYLLSVVVLDKVKYSNTMAMNRVAQVKSQRNVSEYTNGTVNYSETTIRTPRASSADSVRVDVTDIIKTNSIGFAKQMLLLTTFEDATNNKVYIYYKKIQI